MSIKKLALRGCGLLALVLGALDSAGCGGSAFSDGGNGGAAGSAIGSAGSGVSEGGSAGACAAACPAIACGPGSVSVFQAGDCCPSCLPVGQGGGASGGSTGIGGCSGVVACPGVACVAGYTSVIKPGDCCPTCVPTGTGGSSGSGGSAGSSSSAGSGGLGGCASTIACPAIDCAQGYTLEKKADECCPSCVTNADACSQGQQGYTTLRQKLLQGTGVLACKVASDCTTVPGSAYCGDACSATPANVTSAPGINSQLSSYATNNCSTCTPSYPPCAAPLPPVCANAVCTTGVVIAG